MIDHVRRIAARIVFAFLLLALVLSVVISMTVSVSFAAFIFGGITLGPVLTVLVQHAADYRRGRSLDVIGRDVGVPTDRSVLRARKPAGLESPTKWRNAKGHVRYSREDAS